MKDEIYLVMTVSGVVRMTKKPPKLAGDQRSVMIAIDVADEIFEYTFMKSELKIEEGDVTEPTLKVELLHANEKL